MRIVAKAVVILFSLMAVMATAYYTLGKNLQAGVYPTDADSIGIPLIETASSLIVILVPLTFAFLITSITFFRKRVVLFIGAFLYLCGAVLAALLAFSWFMPNHYSIAAAYVFLAIVATTFAVFAFRKSPSNHAVKRDALNARPLP